MTPNMYGDNFRIITFGESHGPALGVVIDGVRAGMPIDLDEIQRELERRRPGQSKLVTPRKESDIAEILSGIFEGKTTGAPIAILFRNTDARSHHYDSIKDALRPGHADFTWLAKFGIRDWRGGGRTSGRETIARVAAGAIAKQLLGPLGVRLVGHVIQVGSVKANPIPPSQLDPAIIESNPMRCADAESAKAMARAVESAKKAGDSLGGIVEIVALNVPAGWGDPVFQKLDAQLAAALMSIGAVKAVEIGDGFALAQMRGSESNDPIAPTGFLSNHMGGVLGGITNGEPIVVRIAVKPTSSIRHEQSTITTTGSPTTIRVPGRHDPCICPRLVPVAEAMMALVLGDAALRHHALTVAPPSPESTAVELAFTDAEIVRLLHRRRDLLATQPPPPPSTLGAVARAESAVAAGFSPAAVDDLFAAINTLTASPPSPPPASP